MEEKDIILINRILGGECTEELLKQLKQWIEADETNRKEFESYKQLWHSTHSKSPSAEKVAMARKKLLNHISRQQKTERHRRMRKIMAWSAAAVVALMVSFTAAYVHFTSPQEMPLAEVEAMEVKAPAMAATIMTADGETIDIENNVVSKDSNSEKENIVEQITEEDGLLDFSNLKAAVDTKTTVKIPQCGYYSLRLSDGTKVMLNSASELLFPTTFAEATRQVFLKGEAYFEVAHDAERKFVVSTPSGVDIVVHSTSFNVNAYNPKHVETTLVEGRVECRAKGETCAMLTPNQKICVHDDGSTSKVTEVDTYLYTAWKDGKFVFENESIELIMTRISQWYGIDVKFDNEAVKHQKFTGILSRFSNPVDILKRIESTTVVEFYVKGNTVIVR